jgi:serine/threonine protein kinase
MVEALHLRSPQGSYLLLRAAAPMDADQQQVWGERVRMAGSSVLTGRHLAEYHLGQLLGEDSFGQVYEAFHVSLRRDLALRVLSERFTFAAGFEERFAHMGRVLAVLEHPNLLTLDDYGREGPYAYLVTPLVEASSLEDWLREHPNEPATPAQVMRIIGQLTSVLRALHQARVTHLGITPGRVLLEPNGHLLLASLGLPYLAEELWRGWNERQTLGNPVFLAPEQLNGSAPSSAACDIYAVGVILYRLLSGSLPFPPSSPAILEAKFKPPPSMLGKKHSPPPALEALTLRALHPVPEQRWPSINDFAEAFYGIMQTAGYDRSAGAAPGSAYRAAAAPQPIGIELLQSQNKGTRSRSLQQLDRTSPYLPALDTHAEAGAPRSGPGAGPLPVTAFASEAAAPPRPKRGLLTRLKFVVFTTIKILVLPLIIAVLGFAILFGYARWQQLQAQPQPTPAPSVTPTPKQSSVPLDEKAQALLLVFPGSSL